MDLRRLGDAVRAGGGAVIKTVGEGVLASFSQVTAAVDTASRSRAGSTAGAVRLRCAACALAFTRGVRCRNRQRPARLFRNHRSRHRRHSVTGQK